ILRYLPIWLKLLTSEAPSPKSKANNGRSPRGYTPLGFFGWTSVQLSAVGQNHSQDSSHPAAGGDRSYRCRTSQDVEPSVPSCDHEAPKRPLQSTHGWTYENCT